MTIIAEVDIPGRLTFRPDWRRTQNAADHLREATIGTGEPVRGG